MNNNNGECRKKCSPLPPSDDREAVKAHLLLKAEKTET